MCVDDLTDWVNKARTDTVAAYGGKVATWWPAQGRGGQGQTTTFAWAVVMRAAAARAAPNLVKGSKLTLNVNFHGDAHRAAREALLTQLWQDHRHKPDEILVDYAVHDWMAAAPLCVTAESEVYAAHGVKPSLTRADDYSWDFYKLVLVRSPLRLMIARVGTVDDASGTARRDELQRTFAKMLEWYGNKLVGDGVEVGFVILPEAHDSDPWNDLRVGWWASGDAAPAWARPWAGRGSGG